MREKINGFDHFNQLHVISACKYIFYNVPFAHCHLLSRLHSHPANTFLAVNNDIVYIKH